MPRLVTTSEQLDTIKKYIQSHEAYREANSQQYTAMKRLCKVLPPGSYVIGEWLIECKWEDETKTGYCNLSPITLMD